MTHHTPKDKVLNTLKKAGEPLSAEQIAEATALDRQAVDKATAELENSGAIMSPDSTAGSRPRRADQPLVRVWPASQMTAKLARLTSGASAARLGPCFVA